MSTSPLRMVLDDLKDLFEKGKLTFEQWSSEVAAAHRRAESSSSPPRDHGSSQGVVSPLPRIQKVERQVPTKSAKQERCDRQVVSEKKVVPDSSRCKCVSGKKEQVGSGEGPWRDYSQCRGQCDKGNDRTCGGGRPCAQTSQSKRLECKLESVA